MYYKYKICNFYMAVWLKFKVAFQCEFIIIIIICRTMNIPASKNKLYWSILQLQSQNSYYTSPYKLSFPLYDSAERKKKYTIRICNESKSYQGLKLVN